VSALACLVTALTMAAGAQQKIDRPGIRNFTKVDAVVACGGAIDASAIEGLKSDGFKSIINLRLASETGANIDEHRARATALGLNYIHLPFNPASPDDDTVGRFLAAVADRANQPVFIHCGSANRVGAVWLVKRVLQDGWAVDKALAEAKLIGLSSAPLEQFALEYIAAHRKQAPVAR
jgi:uncharacterized protein (TIGR01244 family)